MALSSTTRLLALAAFVSGLGIDLATKAWAAASLMEPVRIADWLYLMLHHNTGVFLGTVPVSSWYWIGVCAAMGWFGWRAMCSPSAPLSVCLAMVLSGLMGNAIGHAQGAVVDFIGVGPVTGDGRWMFVNVADVALVGGGLALGFYLIRHRLARA